MYSAVIAPSQEPEDYSGRTLQEIIALQEETHLASRELRLKIKLIVDRRLAKEISVEQFRADRLAASKLQAIFHHRHHELGVQIQQRRHDARRNGIQS